MSRENVEVVRRLQPDPQVNLVELFEAGGTDAEVEAAIAAAAPAFTDDFVCVFHALSEEPRSGVRGLRECWLDWLAPWEGYRAEVEELIDAGDRVLVLSHDFGRRPGMDKEVDFHGCAVWTVAYPPLSDIDSELRREFQEALLEATRFEDLPGKWQAALLESEANAPDLKVIEGG